MNRTLHIVFALFIALAPTSLFAQPADARAPLSLQPLPDRDAVDRPTTHLRDVREEAPRHAFLESPFNLAPNTMFAGVVGQGTTSHGTQTGEGGVRIGGSPLPRLALHGLVARDAAGKWAPTLTAHYRLLGSLEQGAALGALAQYKTEGFTEAGGEAELGLTGGLRARRFALDMNLLAGVGVEEKEVGEMDAEAKLRVGYDVLDAVRVGAEGQFRQRVAGDRALVGGRKWDALGGPQIIARVWQVTLAATGGATTVNVASGVGAFGMVSVTAMTH